MDDFTLNVSGLCDPNPHCDLEHAHQTLVDDVMAIPFITRAEKFKILLNAFFYRCDIETLPFVNHTQMAEIYNANGP